MSHRRIRAVFIASILLLSVFSFYCVHSTAAATSNDLSASKAGDVSPFTPDHRMRQDTGSISGTVWETDGTTPIPNAFVCINDRVTHQHLGCWDTLSDGTFLATGLPEGTYRADARASGFAAELYDEVLYYGDHGLATPISVTAGAETTDINFTLDPGGTISGTIFAADGVTTLGGVTVDTEPGGFGFCSNPDGTFTLTNLPLDTSIFVYAGGTGWGGCSQNDYAKEYYDGVPSYSSATPIFLASGGGEDETDVDFKLDLGGTITGTVYESDGTTSISSATVCANFYDSNDHVTCQPVQSDGTYTLASLAGGDYRINAWATGFIEEYYNEKPYFHLADRVTVVASTTTPTIDFTLDPGGSITGIVTEIDGTTPIPSAYVCVEAYGYDPNGPAHYGCHDVNSDGTYTVTGIPTGDVRVEAFATGYERELYQETVYYDLATPVHVDAPNNVPDINFTLDIGGTVSGHIWQSDGTTPVNNPTVCINDYYTNNHIRCRGGSGTVNSDGSYTFDGLPTGDFRVEAYADDYAREYYDGQSQSELAAPVHVTAGSDTPNIDFTLDVGGSISGVITETDGTTPIPGATVCANFYDTNTHVSCQPVQPDGSYTFTGLTSGDYRLNAWGPAFIEEYYDNQPYFHLADRVTVTAPDDTPGINFSLDPGGTFSGTIYQNDGLTPVGFGQICVNNYNTGEGHGCFNANGDGSYTTSGLPAGTYRATAWAQGYAKEVFEETVYLEGATNATPIGVTLGSDTSGINFTLDPGGTISGTVFAEDGTTPLSNVPVDTIWGGYGMCTQQDGSYTLQGLPLNWDIKISSGGGNRWCGGPPNNRLEEFWEETADRASATPIVLTAGEHQNITDIDFTLAEGGSVSGTVYETDGTTPISDATVCVNEYDTGMGYGCSNTDANGAYTVMGLPTDDYRIEALAPYRIREYFQEQDLFHLATRVSVTAPGAISDIDFTLDPGGSLSGIVTEADGVTPIGHAEVCVSAYDGPMGYGCWNVNGDGTYMIYGLPSGTFRVDARAAGFARELYDGVSYYGDHSLATPVTVSVGVDTTGINFMLEPGGSVSFTVYAEDGVTPLAGVPVDTDPQSFFDCSDVDGTKTFTDLPLDTPIYIYAGGSGWWGCSNQGYLREYWQEVPDINSATPIILTSENPHVAGLEFTLTKGGTIAGSVYEADGTTAINNAEVCASDTNTYVQVGCRQTNLDGTYALDGLPTGTYILNARGDGWGNEYYDSAGPSGTNATVVAVTAGNVTPDIDFNLDPGGSISGTVYAVDGTTPLANVPVSTLEIWMGACTDANGNYTLSSIPLDTPATVWAGSTNDWCIGGGPGPHVREYWQESPTQDGATPITLTAASPERTGIDFTLADVGSISGTVYEADGVTPVSNARVCVRDYTTGPFYGCWDTNFDGTYTIPGLPGGTYLARARATGYAEELYEELPAFGDESLATPINVSDGADTSGIDFTLDPGGTISGTVYAADGTTPLGSIPVNTAPWGGPWGSFGQCTNPDGSFTIEGLPLDTDIYVEAGGGNLWCSGTPNNYVKEYWEDAVDLDSATAIVLSAGSENESGIDFTLADGGAISGTVYAADGTTPLGGAFIGVHNVDTHTWIGGGESSGDGTYTIQALPSGTYNVYAGGTGYAVEYYDDAKPGVGTITEFSITSGTSHTGVDFVLEPGGTLSGTVYALDGTTTLEGIYVGVENDLWPGACTAADGTFTVQHLPLDIPLYVSAGGTDYCHHSSEYSMEWWDETIDKALATPVTLTAGTPDQAGIIFTLAPAGATFCEMVTEIPLAECQALETLYNNTNGDNWTDNTNWLLTTTPSNWYGVTVESGHVTAIALDGNELNGSIPPELGNLTHVSALNLSNNRFTGELPAELGNLINLTNLALENNAFEGELPASIVNLTALTSTNLGYNMLWTTDPAVETFVTAKDLDWADTQTIPPSEVAIGTITADSIELTWSTIPYTGDGGYYEVGYAETAGGSYTSGCTTANKTESSCTVTGLSGDTPYYLAVRTYTPAHGDQQNDLWSPFSDEVSVASTTFTISGFVTMSSGDGIGGVVMNGLPGSPVTYSGGYYAATVPYGWAGVVTPQKAGYTFTPTSRTYTNVTTDRIGDNYTGNGSFRIVGYVKTAGGEGIGGVVMNGLPGTPITYPGGYYEAYVPAGWSGTVTPRKDGYTFTPANRTYTNVTAVFRDQDFTGEGLFRIAGYVKTATGDGIGGVVMDGLPGNPATYSGGYYEAYVPYGWSGTVTPLKAGYTFTPASRVYTNVTDHQRSQDYTGAGSFWIVGYVKTPDGTGIGGVVMSGFPTAPTTYSGGFYAAQVPAGWSGTATPLKDGYTFTPTSRTYTNVTADQLAQDYTGTGTFQIMGYVRMATGEGIGGVALDGLPGSPVTYSGGFYMADIPYGWSGTVTPLKAGYTFTPASRVYTNLTEHQLDQNYTGAGSFWIVGYVKTPDGAGIGGVAMSGFPTAPTTYSGGFYAAQVPAGWSGTVTPLKDGYTFTPASRTYVNVTTDQPGQDYAGTGNFQIVGYVRTPVGDGIGGVVLNGLPGSPVTYSGGFYAAEVPYGWSGTVTPLKDGYTFTPASRVYTNVTEHQREQNYSGDGSFRIVGYVKTAIGDGIGDVVMSGLPGEPTTYSGGFYIAYVPAG